MKKTVEKKNLLRKFGYCSALGRTWSFNRTISIISMNYRQIERGDGGETAQQYFCICIGTSTWIA